MLGALGLSVMFASALLVVVADIIIKKVSSPGDFWAAFMHPAMIAVYVLYLVQILLAIYIFMNDGKLAVYGNLYIVFYSVLMLAGGVVFFKEDLTLFQVVGVCAALIGGLLINGYRFGIQ